MSMILRWIWVGLILGLWFLIRRALRRAAVSPSGRRRPGPRRSDRGEMVRDRVCNTFLPRSRAILVRDDGEEHFFCSETCRSAFLARRDAAGS